MNSNNLKKFSFTITDNSTWIGQDLLDFYSNALLKFSTAQALTVLPNVKSYVRIPSYNLGNIIQADTLGSATSWNPSGEGTFTDKQFTVTPLKLQFEIPKVFAETNFLSEYIKSGSNSSEVLPDAFEKYVAQLTAKQLGQDLEKICWGGTGTGSTYPVEFSAGFINTMSADSAVNKITYSAATAANVVGILQTIYQQIPEAVFQNFTDLKFYVSANVARIYRMAQAQVGAGQGYNWASDDIKLNFLGIELVECPGLAGSQIVIASMQNMLLLTDLMEDFEKDSSLKIIDMYENFGVASLRIALRFKIGFGYKVGAEIVLHA